MGEFLKFVREFLGGWRRKAGSLTLVMALVLMVGWIRSETIGDDITFRIGNCATEIQSEHGTITTIMTWARNDDRWLPPNDWTTGFSPVAESKSKWEKIGFLYNAWKHDEPGSTLSFQRLLMVPYWSLVFPLSLLAARLLLRKRKPAKPTETN